MEVFARKPFGLSFLFAFGFTPRSEFNVAKGVDISEANWVEGCGPY